MASSPNLSAAQRLEALRRLRMTGKAPSSAIMVTTQRDRTELFQELRLATIEVWPGVLPRLDWRGVAGLYVVAVVHWREQADRLKLFDAIRAAEPYHLHWMGPDSSVILINGEVWEPSFPELWRNYGRV